MFVNRKKLERQKMKARIKMFISAHAVEGRFTFITAIIGELFPKPDISIPIQINISINYCAIYKSVKYL